MTIPKPKVLIIGEADEGTFEKTLHEYLLLNDRWAECSVESKSSPNLVATVKDMGKTASPRAWLNRSASQRLEIVTSNES